MLPFLSVFTKSYHPSYPALQPRFRGRRTRPMSDHRQIEQAYLEGWRQKDLARIQTHLHPNVTFKGPIAEIAGREDFTAAVQRMLGLLKDVEVRGIFEDG